MKDLPPFLISIPCHTYPCHQNSYKDYKSIESVVRKQRSWCPEFY